MHNDILCFCGITIIEPGMYLRSDGVHCPGCTRIHNQRGPGNPPASETSDHNLHRIGDGCDANYQHEAPSGKEI